MLMHKEFSCVCIMLSSLCYISLRNRLEREADCQGMVKTCKHDAMKLCSLLKKSCNGSTPVLGDDALGNAVEVLCSYLHFRGNEHDSLSKFIGAS